MFLKPYAFQLPRHYQLVNGILTCQTVFSTVASHLSMYPNIHQQVWDGLLLTKYISQDVLDDFRSHTRHTQFIQTWKDDFLRSLLMCQCLLELQKLFSIKLVEPPFNITHNKYFTLSPLNSWELYIACHNLSFLPSNQPQTFIEV